MIQRGRSAQHSLSRQRHPQRQHPIIRHQYDLLPTAHPVSIRRRWLLAGLYRWRGELSWVHGHGLLSVRGERRMAVRPKAAAAAWASVVVRRERATRHAWVGLLQRGRCVCEQTAQIVALDHLRHRARLDIADLDECGFKREHVRVLECCVEVHEQPNAEMHASTHQSSSALPPNAPKSSSVTYARPG